MSPPIIFFLFILSIVNQTSAKTFGICELVMELKQQGFPEDQIADWVCLIEAESSRRTEVVGGPDSDGSYDHGLFQINDRYWCSTGDYPGKGCNVRCSDLRTDDITEASKCAKIIFTIHHGFDAWVGWRIKCKGVKLPELHC